MELAKHCTSSRPDASEECKVRMDKRMQQCIWEAEENFSLATKLWLIGVKEKRQNWWLIEDLKDLLLSCTKKN